MPRIRPTKCQCGALFFIIYHKNTANTNNLFSPFRS